MIRRFSQLKEEDRDFLYQQGLTEGPNGVPSILQEEGRVQSIMLARLSLDPNEHSDVEVFANLERMNTNLDRRWRILLDNCETLAAKTLVRNLRQRHQRKRARIHRSLTLMEL